MPSIAHSTGHDCRLPPAWLAVLLAALLSSRRSPADHTGPALMRGTCERVWLEGRAHLRNCLARCPVAGWYSLVPTRDTSSARRASTSAYAGEGHRLVMGSPLLGWASHGREAALGRGQRHSGVLLKLACWHALPVSTVPAKHRGCRPGQPAAGPAPPLSKARAGAVLHIARGLHPTALAPCSPRRRSRRPGPRSAL